MQLYPSSHCFFALDCPCFQHFLIQYVVFSNLFCSCSDFFLSVVCVLAPFFVSQSSRFLFLSRLAYTFLSLPFLPLTNTTDSLRTLLAACQIIFLLRWMHRSITSLKIIASRHLSLAGTACGVVYSLAIGVCSRSGNGRNIIIFECVHQNLVAKVCW